MPTFHRCINGAGRLLPVLVLFALLAGCGGQGVPTNQTPDEIILPGREKLNVDLPKVKFTNITSSAGVDFRHTNGAFGKKLLPETMGSGVVFFDYDNDGKQDVLLVNSCWWPGYEDKQNPHPIQALYRNLGHDKFENITKKAGLDLTMYGMGATAGDIDNDGFTDLFITALGGNHLFHNQPDGKGGRKFVDITSRSSGMAPDGAWATDGDFLKRDAVMDFPSSAAFFDYNNDGLLDLFVCNYVTWSPGFDLSQGFTIKGAGRAYGPPRAFKGNFCQLFKNAGAGSFVDVSAEAGIRVTGELGERVGKSLGVVICDPDDDGWPDVIVANDTVRNFFFHNRGDGTFEERGQRSGIGYPAAQPRGAMGIDFGEYREGQYGIIIGNFANEPDTLLRLDFPKRLGFSDVAAIEGVGGPSQIMLVFGLFWFDFDLDGRLDLLTCNGHLEPDIHLAQPGQTYKQPPQLFWNTGTPRAFEPLSAKEVGPDLLEPMVGRSCAFADIDGDGDLDVVLTANGGRARLLRNEGGTGHHWVRLVLEGDGKKTNRSAIGARIVLTASGKKYRSHVTSARGYLSQSELPVTFGLGKTKKIDRLEIYWPGTDRRPQVLTNLEVDRSHHIHQEAKE